VVLVKVLPDVLTQLANTLRDQGAIDERESFLHETFASAVGLNACSKSMVSWTGPHRQHRSFASSALGRLSQLSAWWIRLGITPELIEPAHPEQNGRHERFHKTLKADATRPAAATRAAQQRRFTRFRQEYNTERPHEALGQQPPGALYTPSSRPYPRRLPPLVYPAQYEVRLVSANGGVRWRRGWVNCSHVLAGEYIGLEEVAAGIWAVSFGPVLLGRFQERTRAIIGAHNRNRLRTPRP
jgi:hypothetical protein